MTRSCEFCGMTLSDKLCGRTDCLKRADKLGLKRFKIRTISNPPVFMIELGLAQAGVVQTAWYYGKDKQDAMDRAGII